MCVVTEQMSFSELLYKFSFCSFTGKRVMTLLALNWDYDTSKTDKAGSHWTTRDLYRIAEAQRPEILSSVSEFCTACVDCADPAAGDAALRIHVPRSGFARPSCRP